MLLRSILYGYVISISALGHAQSSDFFDSDIVSIEIMFEEPAWNDTLTARKLRNDKESLVASVSINGALYEQNEVRYKGNSSFHGAFKQGWKKFPLRIKAASGHAFEGKYKKLRLANNYRDPSAIRELLAYKIAGTYVPVPKVVPATVTINGTYIGLYTLTEGIAKAMMQEYYCDDSGVLIQCEPDFHASLKPGCPKGDFANLEYLGEEVTCYERLYDIEKEKESRALIELTRRLNSDRRLDTVIDIHQTLWMHALNNVLVNLDSYLGLFCHNYFMYKDQHGTYHPLIWDLNLAFGGFSSIAPGESPEPIKLSPIAHDRFLKNKRPLIQRLIEDKEGAHIYFWMMKTIVDEWITSGKYLATAEEIQQRIRPYIQKEKDALYSVKDFDNSILERIKHENHRSIIGIAQLMEPRAEYLDNHVLLNKSKPVVNDCVTSVSGEKMRIEVKTSEDVRRIQLCYRQGSCGKQKSLDMEQISDVIWEAEVPSGSSFYCVVSSTTGAILYPKHAPLELEHHQ